MAASLQAPQHAGHYVLAATIERIARKLLRAGGFVAVAAAFACLWLVPGATTTVLPFLCPDLRSRVAANA
jgi:hypothetical protein